MTTFDPAAAAEELLWLKDHPDFEERPASIEEFLGEGYLNIRKGMREPLVKILIDLFGDEVNGHDIALVQRAMVTGGIGIGKTTLASIVLPYLTHWCLCLRSPQDYFDLLPGSRIAFMQMSTSGSQAKEVVFGDIKARIEHSPWFQRKYPYDRDFKNQLRFAKDIWILPGDSAETTFEGYNILGGILDEADSHKVTKNKDYAEQGYRTIHTRITSRFEERGFLLVIGQMKKGIGFAATKFHELKRDPKAYTALMSIWESLGWEKFLNKDGSRDSFHYDSKRHEIVPPGAHLAGDHILEIPTVYRTDFENNPELALRDLAGVPPPTGSPFITLAYKIPEAIDRWKERYEVDDSPVGPDGVIADWFECKSPLKRVGHLDVAYSPEGDALGFAMGHVHGVTEVEGERKPYIIFDLLMRMHAPPGREIHLGDVRRFIYSLQDDLGFNLHAVNTDGFQSTDTRQQLKRRRIRSELISVDKDLTPYYDLREAIYEDRIEFPPYVVRLRPEDTNMTEILVKELSELVDNGDKVDHPPEGSKDVADSVAGVVYTLMGTRAYHRNVVSMETIRQRREERAVGGNTILGDGQAPIPPSLSAIPPRLSARRTKGRRR